MHTTIKYAIAGLLLTTALVFSRTAAAGLDIFACEPEWGALVKELAGDKARLYIATSARQDPHRIEARPSLIARARSAQLVVCTGADLEIGWLPLVQQQSANPAIQTGRPGYFEAAREIMLLDVPRRLDRSQGDVHAAGNPHVHLDPRNIARIAAALAERLAELDPKEAPHYRGRAKIFLERWREATTRWEKQGALLKGVPIVVYHQDLTYLVRWLGMREAGTLEPKPGLPPTTGHLSELLAQLAREPAKAIVRAAYSDPRPGEWLSERTRIPLVVLPYTVGGTDKAGDLFGLFDDTLARLTAVAK
jgi:zinc/manganese transport system substrate-binding protein